VRYVFEARLFLQRSFSERLYCSKTDFFAKPSFS
jgi:hypothetical protein